MKKEIDQRKGRNELILGCRCGSKHFLYMDWIVDETWLNFEVAILDHMRFDFWERVKRAFKYILGNENLWYVDITLNEKDLIKMKKHIDKYIEARRNFKQ